MHEDRDDLSAEETSSLDGACPITYDLPDEYTEPSLENIETQACIFDAGAAGRLDGGLCILPALVVGNRFQVLFTRTAD